MNIHEEKAESVQASLSQDFNVCAQSLFNELHLSLESSPEGAERIRVTQRGHFKSIKRIQEIEPRNRRGK